MGCIGMGMEDFCRCTPSEFRKVYDAWLKHQRSGWEQARMLAMFVYAPYNKKRKRANEVWPLPWDNERKEEKHEQLSKEERAERYRKAAERYGLKA